MRERAVQNPASAVDQSALENGNAMEMTSTGAVVASGNELAPPTQEEEDEELRRRPLARRVLEGVFPVFTRPAGAFRRGRRVSRSAN